MVGFKTLLLVLAVALAVPVTASASASTSTLKARPLRQALSDIEYKFNLSGLAFSEAKDEGAAAAVELGARFDYRMSSMFKAHFAPGVALFSGRLQERFEDDRFENHFLLESHLSFQPVKQFELRAGILSQEQLRMPILISNHRVFPGAQEIVSVEAGDLKLGVMAQQLIPSSYSVNAERSGKEPLPGFATQSLFVEGKHFGWLEWSGAAGHFSWTDTPEKVAYQSARGGNTAIGGEAVPGTRLKYGFDGYFWRAKGCLCGPALVQLEAEYQGLVNRRAPSFAADAQAVGGGPRFRFRDLDLELAYYSYFIESDATVSRYLSSNIGRANRLGDQISASLDFKKQGFKIYGHHMNARTLADSPNQQTMTYFEMGLETDYAPF